MRRVLAHYDDGIKVYRGSSMTRWSLRIASLATICAVVHPTGCVERKTAPAANGGSAASSSNHVCDRDGAIANIDDSDYDQSCTTDADCVAVPQGDVCYDCIRACRGGVVNRTAEAQYRSDIAKLAQSDANTQCFCPLEFTLCCVDGECRSDGKCGK